MNFTLQDGGLRSRTGTYALVYSCNAAGVVEIGKLGTLGLHPGHYVYIGSAFGPGGMRARIRHHLAPSPRPHWHIDYLKPRCTLREIWVEYSGVKHESRWAARLSRCGQSSVPLIGFGASDGRAPSHLFYFESRPSPDLLPTTRSIRIEVTPQG